jgi:anti-sigma regulatory factor (Ser/Thr protein kinase)
MHETANDPSRIASFTLEGSYEDSNLDDLCDELHAVWSPTEKVVASQIDLRKLGSLEPASLALVLGAICGVSTRAHGATPTAFLAPETAVAPTCLQAEHLERLIEGGPGLWRVTDDEELLGVEVFSSLHGIDRTIASLQQNLALNTDLPEASMRSMRTMVFELSENVMQHSKASRGVVVLRFLSTTQSVRIAICDDGMGIRRSLTQNPKFRDRDDDLAAIAASMGAGATAEPGTGGGMGLYLARLVVRGNDGKLTIRSGDACREEGDDVSDSTLLPPLRGTLVIIDANGDRPFDYGRIDDTLLKPAGITDRTPYQAGPAT